MSDRTKGMEFESMVVTVGGKCLKCDGAGRLCAPHCTNCGAEFTQDDVKRWIRDPIMRCGCDRQWLEEAPECPECEGSGRIAAEVPLLRLGELIDQARAEAKESA
jgi:hypothetical protein